MEINFPKGTDRDKVCVSLQYTLFPVPLLEEL